MVAEDTPEGLKRLVAERPRARRRRSNAVFMTYTGRSLDEDVEEDEADDRLTPTKGGAAMTTQLAPLRRHRHHLTLRKDTHM